LVLSGEKMENRREPGENSNVYKGLAVHKSDGIVAALSPLLDHPVTVSILVSKYITKSTEFQSRKEMTRSAKSAWLGGHLAENHWSPTSHLSPGDDILLLLAHPGLDDVGADEAGGHDNQTVKGFAAALSIPMF